MTSTRPTYKSPPITECLFDIRVSLPAKINEADLRELAKSIALDYPDMQPQRMFEGQFRIDSNDGSSNASAIDLGVNGYISWSKEKNQAVQFRLDGFTYNRLEPYTGWDSCFVEAFKFWQVYQRKIIPTSIASLAVRYINTIKIPFKQFVLSDYLTGMDERVNTLQEVAAQEPEVKQIFEGAFMEAFLYQDTVRLPSKNIKVVKTRTIGPNSSKSETPIILDIETIKSLGNPLEDGQIKDIFNELHDIKNVVFEQCITDKTRGLFQ
mgnify:CR=1 FL=1